MKPTVDHKPARVNVISTKTSERQLSRIVNRRGGPFMPVVQAELARYIACCEQVGRELIRRDRLFAMTIGSAS